MSLILSIETATAACSVALHHTGKLIGHTTLFTDRSHSEYLMPIIEDLLKNSNYDRGSLAAIAISGGPGSFTGLRIGTAVAKGLCYGLAIPLISVGTLEAMAYGMRSFVDKETLLCPALEARRTAIYTLIADQAGQIKRPAHVALLDSKVYRDALPCQSLLFFGDGVPKCKTFLMEDKKIHYIEQQVVPSAIQIGYLAFLKFQKQLWEDMASYTPYYLSQFQ
ncbi:MAG: tRNA (adenosine(37)-N6)-threonylcarbamoyltransferase complex dimerization subunit type 1 TsaB [Candidatus Cardinium sp.]|uniref:tRNA (adenosine(37)-N6)-threonylcarbamoyltransferase complex dimerization subunit type 1 TsaB n=1 Tax=Cardinium endosymbiont of Dermatophagoides farinae TaxID=2597823 RepID=UPI001182EACD|nr:tRNA (adenosine(37)-N6)-threonylcarbamoyltransferase complex dimerization subunit type 1 TsaB [Cardinium endosymbiont of Dermatophagoides farinae]TSJ80809.1 tRNA (adenosine(37)-N6)-threonylcarbamoyltransferase complex dimerization subunit type 1 TsaB [Cardinium endosymbiont of Dermatophagoides farinae]UWW96813.1 MAG: tRNA (adenosine(37)-N6)-threonylcarbamoyltransferase complex dimerization subunit type 1 TsaB [Candidatus Cardinium sp.]